MTQARSFFNADDLSLLIMEHPDAPQFLAVKIADAHDAAMAQAAARLRELEADNARLLEALADLASWFTTPQVGGQVWMIQAGERGADDAVNAARTALRVKP